MRPGLYRCSGCGRVGTSPHACPGRRHHPPALPPPQLRSFLESENARLRQENRELKTLAKVGLWHDDCRLNRRQAAEIIEKMSIVEGKLVDTITEVRRDLDTAQTLLADIAREWPSLEWASSTWGDTETCPFCRHFAEGDIGRTPKYPANTHANDCLWVSLSRRLADALRA